MSFAHTYQAVQLERAVRHILPSYALEHLDAALNGDTEEAFALSVATPHEDRGVVAVVLYLKALLGDTSRIAYAIYLENAWEQSHRAVVAAAENRQRLRAMFRHAAFQLPQDWPETIRIWRGTSGLPLEQARRGVSWTISRDVACWLAMRFAGKNGSPIVLVAVVEPRSIT